MDNQGQISIHSIQFSFSGSSALHLREPATDSSLRGTPEWRADSQEHNLVAYVRGTQPDVRIVLKGHHDINGQYAVNAQGGQHELEELVTDISFDASTGLSTPIDLRFKNPLPDCVGVHSVKFKWGVRPISADSTAQLIGMSTHTVCTTWGLPAPNPQRRLHDWVYAPIVLWTSEWAAGQHDAKGVCDAIFENLEKSRLRYGVSAHDVRNMLLVGGGMCGGWYKMFQHMAHSQGVFVHRRSFLVDWQPLPGGEAQWCALVIKAPGLNQRHPTHPRYDFHDNDDEFPISHPVSVIDRCERRYRFWGCPNSIEDGHCINFLEHQGRLYLYDACFGIGPIEIDDPLPPLNLTTVGCDMLPTFKTRYLDLAVDYMLGSIYNGKGGTFYETIRHPQNGMTVGTHLLQGQINGAPALAFRWVE